jgi:hypothetical protein
VRPALVFVAGALDEGEPSLIEDLLEAGQPRVQPEGDLRRVGADLRDLAGRDRSVGRRL